MTTSNESRTLPRGFKYELPKTPEPISTEPRQPSPPRQRLKVRRPNPSSLHAPTQHFLASVAAADVLVPTIEVAAGTEDLEMPDREGLSIDASALRPPPQYSAPPTTPVPMLSVTMPLRPDWSMSASPGEDSSLRSASSLSDASYYSDDSLYDGSIASRPSDDGSCTSPESDISDPFQFPICDKKVKARLRDDTFCPPNPLNNKIRSKTRKDAPWSSDQSAHLWSTYMVYLQDPTVTPFRIGASAVPPEGVCHRVAREARRSWRGQKAEPLRRSSRMCSSLRSSEAPQHGGSPHPTETAKVYGTWPHASGATRSHLREMCRSKDSSSVSRYRHHQSPGPTPFTRLQFRPRTPEPPGPSRASSISCKDIALSLSATTADSMQPEGPLAQLAVDSPTDLLARRPFAPLEEFKPMSFGESRGFPISTRGRLASPFVARTYGPSSSQNFQSRPSPSRSQSDTIRHLRSPLCVNASHSLNGTQKRRAQNDLEEEEPEPVGVVARPSVLNEQLFGTPLNQRRVRCRGFSLGDEALRHHSRGSGFFQRSPTPVFEFPGLPPPDIKPPSASALIDHPNPPPSAAFGPPRLGSPFSESGSSQTFPRRLFQDGSSTIRRSAFATMHQTRHSIESFDFGQGPSLQGRLEKLDTKLKEIREREVAARQNPQ
ncbi:hypothetical protein QTJ16_006562 [Diplocarpon rosae]|uniref:Uncharacterized protein n=1 Tax=Diplocarpon rosae TaxID=946125 RepID=A0AAD9WB79_9HELO|nr:hypothetical protein QTJ16_006562 [Diplocarpon rosae]